MAQTQDQHCPPRGRAGHAARAVLRPRLRSRAHAVHHADVPPPDLGGPRAGHARPRCPLVVLDGLRVADQRRRPRGGGGSHRHVRRHGVPASRRDLRSRGVQQPRARVRPCLRRGACRPHRVVHPRLGGRSRPSPLDRRPGWRHRGRGGPAARSVALRRAGAGGHLVARTAPGHGRAVLLRLRGLEARPRALRGAARADHHHRLGRVHRRDRRRSRSAASPRGSRRRQCWASPWPRRCGGPISTS